MQLDELIIVSIVTIIIGAALGFLAAILHVLGVNTLLIGLIIIALAWIIP